MDPFPPDSRVRRAGLGKLWLGIFAALIAVAAVAYFVYFNLVPEAPATRQQAAGAESSGLAAPTTAPETSPVPAEPNRSNTILTCTAVNGTVFYTNATRCEDADLENRVNVLPTPKAPPKSRPECLGAQPGEPRVQSFLGVCIEPFNKALELERFLLESDDPVNSRAGERYCALITEGVQAGCMATSNQFCFLDICQAQREKSTQ